MHISLALATALAAVSAAPMTPVLSAAPPAVTRPTAPLGADVTGRITDQAGTPVGDATIGLPELARSTTSDAQGRFRFAGIPAGRYTISVRRLGYVTTAQRIVVGAVSVDLSVTLHSGVLRIEPVNVTGTREPGSALSSPLATSVLAGDQVHAEGGISLAHAVAQLPGVRSVSSGQQIGKPMVRGLFGPRVLILADGSRIEDYSWSDEDGPSIDARLAQRIEVIRGPASVLYGSEALGGVVNVIPSDVPYSADGTSTRRESLEVYSGSNNIELGSAALVEGAQSKYGWRALATGRFAQNYHTPSGSLQNSSFWAFNGEGAFGIRGDHGSTTIRGAHYGGEFHLLEASGPEAGDPTGGPVRQTLDDRLQVTNDYVTHGVRFESKAQWQRHSLAEVSDDCQPVPPATTCTKVKDKQAFGLVLNTGTIDLLAHHSVGEHLNGTVGVSGLFQLSGTTGPIFLVPSATTNSAGAFAFEQFTVGKLTLLGGLRGDTRHLSADASPALSLSADKRGWSDATGDAGVAVRPVTHLALVANYGTGWRAPTLFDLYTNGPNVADARYEIGDATLKSERSKNVDGGVRWQSDRVHADVTIFQNDVDRFIYTAPTAQTIGTLQVFRHRQTNARLNGAELSGAVDLADPLTIRGSYDLVNASDRATGAPLPLTPPPRTIVGVDLHSSHLGWAQRASIGAEVESNQAQTRLGPNDVRTNAYTLVNLDFSMDRVLLALPFRFDVDVRNATNVTYTDFLSRYKAFAYAPGINLIVKASVGAW